MHTSVMERKEQPVRGDRPWNGVSMASAGVAEESYSKNPRGPRNKGAECVIKEALMSSLVSRQAPVWLQQHAKQDEPRSVRKA